MNCTLSYARLSSCGILSLKIKFIFLTSLALEIRGRLADHEITEIGVSHHIIDVMEQTLKLS